MKGKKNHMSTSIDAGKAFDKIQHLEKLGVEGLYLNIIKDIQPNV
jgi:hypothetical protein